MKRFFILGTDTNVGKTVFSVNLLGTLKENGFTTIGLKPVSSGARRTAEGLRSRDAVCLQKAATVSLSYEQVNPFSFELAVSPHIIAAQQSCQLTIKKIIEAGSPLWGGGFVDYCIIEGIGGLCVPLNEHETMLDLVQSLGFPVILVIGIRLGCLNHALLSYQILKDRSISIAACLCNRLDSTMECQEENIASLKRYIQTPFLSSLPYLKDKASLSSFRGANWLTHLK